MDASAIKAMMSEIAPVIREYVEAEVNPLLFANKALAERVYELEERELLLPEKGDPGEPGSAGAAADMDEVARQIEQRVTDTVSAAFATLPIPKDGEPGQPGEPGRDGRDVDDISLVQVGRDVELAFTRGDTKTVFELELPEGPPGKDAAPVDMAEVKALVDAATEAALSALPAPRDGPAGKDGIGVVDALIDRSGGLVHVMADGTVKSLGQVVGADGKDGIGFAEAFEDDGKFIVRMTDGSELTMPLPEAPELPDMEPPEGTCELVAKALRAFAELPEPAIDIHPAPESAKQLPIVLNVNAGGVTQAPPKMVKTITTRRDGAGNLTADIVERPDIE